jgi:hypothetical protein
LCENRRCKKADMMRTQLVSDVEGEVEVEVEVEADVEIAGRLV